MPQNRVFCPKKNSLNFMLALKSDNLKWKKRACTRSQYFQFLAVLISQKLFCGKMYKRQAHVQEVIPWVCCHRHCQWWQNNFKWRDTYKIDPHRYSQVCCSSVISYPSPSPLRWIALRTSWCENRRSWKESQRNSSRHSLKCLDTNSPVLYFTGQNIRAG